MALNPPRLELAFETYCEVMGAMTAWGARGVDSTTEIQNVFGFSMQDFSLAAVPTTNRLQTDVSLMSRYGALVAKAMGKYQRPVQVKKAPDADLSF